MKKVMIVFAVVGLVGAAAAVKAHEGHKQARAKAPAAAAAPATRRPVAAAEVQKVHLTGELIDPQCWFTHNGEGEKHATCAVTCARGGQDLAFLDARTREMYTLIAASHGSDPNADLYDHVGIPVRVRGTSYQRGANRGLMVETIEKVR